MKNVRLFGNLFDSALGGSAALQKDQFKEERGGL